ncbi:unnamed protein product [Linum trigynum]|uniref:Uncharacterized protein n=1 Tax=Linum trigynum TaxID=586398 RepID=A0AAV2FQY8_9ROSI
MRRRPRTARSVAPVRLLIGIGQYPLWGETISTTEGNQNCEQGRYKATSSQQGFCWPGVVVEVQFAANKRRVLLGFKGQSIEKPKTSHKIIHKWISGVVETTIMDAETAIVDTHLIDSFDFLSWDMGDTFKDFTVRERSGQG